ncbi:hypothetical protein LIA77_02037 [Sarocladium implicatum]|nr:hypothetical protein LIA77_02037 [Sarocladium implicatum]
MHTTANAHHLPAHLPPPSSTQSDTFRTPRSSAATHDARPTLIPFTFRRPFQPKLSSTSLEPSIAEGKPIPVDDSTAENRTSALRHLNKTNPSRHRYAKSTGAQSSTYSEPVIVRSYYNPQPSRAPSASRGGVIVTSRRTPLRPRAAEPTTSLSRSMPFAGKAASARDGVLGGMARFTGRRATGTEQDEGAKLPPVEAFTFKSFMDNMEAQSGGSDINADLDRIAEICARSRYSLSNQYEVHYAPHGSGSSFVRNGGREDDSNGPTLQVVSPEEENSTTSRRRRHIGRRNSRAMGTLETIMSSSRSSDEDKSHKKSAAELADEVRGRARQPSSESSPAPHSPGSDVSSQNAPSSPAKSRTGRASSLALIDGTKQGTLAGDTSNPRASASGLLGEPALPQTSTSQLEIRTAPEDPSEELSKDNHAALAERLHRPLASANLARSEVRMNDEGIFSTISSWMPWASPGQGSPGRAEGSLRDLLRAADVKGKDVEAET